MRWRSLESSSTILVSLLLSVVSVLGTPSVHAAEPHPGFVESDPQPGPVADGNVKALCELFEAIGSMQVTGAGQVGVLEEYGQTGYVSCGLSWPQEIAIMGGDSLWPSMSATFSLYRSRDLAMQAYFGAHNRELSGREADYSENALGTAGSHSIDFVEDKAYVSLAIGGLPERSDSMAQQMERIARQVLGRIGPTKYRISIELSTIPLQAVISVTDPSGKLAACNPVHITLDVGVPPGVDNVVPFHEVLVPLSGPPVSTRPSSIPGVPGVVDAKLELLPWASPWHHFDGCFTGGRIVLPLYQLRAKGTATAGDQIFSLNMPRLEALTKEGATLGASLKVRIPIHDDKGNVVDYAAEKLVFGLDHIGQILGVSDVFARGATNVKVTRNGKEELAPAGFRLRGGDTVTLIESPALTQQIVLGSVLPLKMAVRVKEGQGPQDITLASPDIEESYKGDVAAGANAAGVAASAAGLILSVKTLGTAGTVVGVIVYVGGDWFHPLDIRRLGSTMLVETGDRITVATTEGSGSVLDWSTDEYVDVSAGHSIVMDTDGSLSPIAAFSVDDLGDEQMSVLDGVSAPIEDDIVTRTEGIHPSDSDGGPEEPTNQPTAAPTAAPGASATPSASRTAAPSRGPTSGSEAVVLFADDFDAENDGLGMFDYGAFANWTVDSGTTDLLGEGLFDFYPDAGLFLDLDGSRNAGATLVSKEAVTLTSGRYRLEFELAGHPFNGPDTVTVALGEVFAEDFTVPHDPDLAGFERMVRDIVVDTESEARLSFRQHGGDNAGVLLDEVRLSRLPGEASDEVDETEPVPVPTATPVPVPTATPVTTPAPTATPVTTPAPTPTVMPLEPAPSPEPPMLQAARDLWLHAGDTVTRVDHLSGEVLERWDVSHPDCPSGHGGRPLVQVDGEAAWLTVADAQWETPVLECLIRLPLDGSGELEAYRVPTGRKPTFVHDAATQGEDLWVITWKKQGPGSTLEYYDDWSLARLDRWTGQLTRVLPRVVALAPTEAGLVVLYSGRGTKAGARRPLRLGIVEPGRKTPRAIDLDAGLPRTKPGTYVTPRLRLSAGHAGTVALYDDAAGRDIIVFVPASGAVIGRVPPPVGASTIGRVWPVSDGVWMSGSLQGGDDFVRYAPFDGWTSLDVDPCMDVARDCYAQVEAASDSGAWVSAWPYDAAFELDLDRVVMRRYDTGGQELAEVAGSEVFGTD